MSRVASAAIALSLLGSIALPPSRALAWEWRDLLRSNNSNVEDGNERLRAGDHQAALAAYDAAAKELPSEGGVHLNRGLALLAAGDLPKARESLLRATEPPATADVRAAAYYNLGLAFYREGDARAGEDDHKEAQAMFREAADALKRSLRLVPGNRDAAWNLELAMRRIRDEQEKQRQQEEQEKQQREQEKQENEGSENQENDESQDGEQQPENGEPQDQQQPKDGDSQGDDQNQPEKPDDEKPQDQQSQEQQPEDQPSQDQPSQEQEGEQPQEAMPREAERALDALQQGEENLERMRARQRAGRERREPSKDW